MVTQATISTIVPPQWSTVLVAGGICPDCGQATTCSVCGRCHYCEDVDLPCSGNNVTAPRNEMMIQATGNGGNRNIIPLVALMPEPEEQPSRSVLRQRIDKAIATLSSRHPVILSSQSLSDPVPERDTQEEDDKENTQLKRIQAGLDAELVRMASLRRQWMAIQFPNGLPEEIAALIPFFSQDGEEVSE